MAKKTTEVGQSNMKRMRPSLDPDTREQQLIALAVDAAEEQLRNGTASSQLICHYLKRSSAREQLELEKIRKENAVLEAKAKAYESAEHIEQLYTEAINAMKGYAGVEDSDDRDEFYD